MKIRYIRICGLPVLPVLVPVLVRTRHAVDRAVLRPVEHQKLPRYRELGPCFSRGWDAGRRPGGPQAQAAVSPPDSAVLHTPRRRAHKRQGPQLTSEREQEVRVSPRVDEPAAAAPSDDTGADILLVELVLPEPEPKN